MLGLNYQSFEKLVCGSFLCARHEIKLVVLPVLPTGPEHVLSKALCVSVAAAGLTQIRKYAAAQEGKASRSATIS